MKARRDCEKQIASEAIHITDFEPVEIAVVKDSSDIISNADYITSITSEENSASKKIRRKENRKKFEKEKEEEQKDAKI